MGSIDEKEKVGTEAMPLKIIIVGGGIGGFSAAIAFRQQGHIVEVYESSAFSKEVGAAMHTPPNGNGVLKGLGVSCEAIGANLATYLSEWTPDGTLVKKIDLKASSTKYEHKWRLAHRIKLHEALRKVATDETGSGTPTKLFLSKQAIDVDSENAIVYFKDGTHAQGDVIIGADGVHSFTRTKLPGGNIQPFPSGLSAIRFLVPREATLADPRTVKFCDVDGDFHGIFGKDRSVLLYPTSNNTLLNFVCIHPDIVSGNTATWGHAIPLSTLLEVYKDFHPDVKALLEKADESSLRVWKLLDMEKLPNWCDKNLAVIGDAAHPFMPFLGQGGSIAIEDAVAIGVILERGTKKEEIPERLRLYQKARKERAELVQYYTRINGKAREEKVAFDVAQYQNYCFGYNEWDHAAEVLREWKESRNTQSVQSSA